MRRKGQSPQRTLLSGVILTTLIIAVAWIAHLAVQNREASRHAHLNALLVAAVQKADAPQVVDLLRQGADPNATVPNERFASPPPTRQERFYQLLSPPSYDGIRHTPLLLCTRRDDDRIALSLLAAGANPNVMDEDSQTALCHAVGDPVLMNTLISKGADVNRGNPLAIAAGESFWNDPAIRAKASQSLQILLAHGATLQGQAGQKVLTSAAGAANLGVVKLLLSKGVPANADALTADAGAGSPKFVKFLLDKGIPVNATDSQGNTALLACATGIGRSEEVARLLLQRGANVRARSSNGSTALIYAAEQDNLPVAQVLLAHKADVNAKKDDSNTALIMAAYNGNAGMIKLLLAHGADFHLRNNNGDTALMMARDCDPEKDTTILRRAGERQ